MQLRFLRFRFMRKPYFNQSPAFYKKKIAIMRLAPLNWRGDWPHQRTDINRYFLSLGFDAVFPRYWCQAPPTPPATGRGEWRGGGSDGLAVVVEQRSHKPTSRDPGHWFEPPNAGNPRAIGSQVLPRPRRWCCGFESIVIVWKPWQLFRNHDNSLETINVVSEPLPWFRNPCSSSQHLNLRYDSVEKTFML